jgi:predicted alpha/beta-hydrolase family hydrolase
MEKIACGDHYINAVVSLKPDSVLNIIISHGENNDMDYGLLVKLFDSLKSNYSIIRFNFSYVDGGLKKDTNINKMELEACIKYFGNRHIVLIGKSYGGILSTRIAAEKMSGILGVIVLGYPLHEYNNPSNLNDVSYLKNIQIPIKFIIGDKDPNCNLGVFNKALPDYKPEIINDSDHSFRPINGIGSLNENEDKVIAIVKKELYSLAKSH